MTMHVQADQRACVASGMCAVTAPAVFTQGESDGVVQVLLSDVPESERTAVRDAAGLCPVSALKITDPPDRAD